MWRIAFTETESKCNHQHFFLERRTRRRFPRQRRETITQFIQVSDLTCMGLTLYRKPVLTRGSMYTPITGIWCGPGCGTRYTAGTSPKRLASRMTSFSWGLSNQKLLYGSSGCSWKKSYI